LSNDKQTVAGTERATRYTSHALVELRRWKLLPFGVHSAVLLDISVGGFKIEFTGEANAKSGDVFWLCVPLTPLGISVPTRLTCKVECRWFDPKRFRIGGTFVSLEAGDKLVIEKLVEALRRRGKIAAP